MDRHDTQGPEIWTIDRNRPLDFSFEDFEAWLRSQWHILKWHYADWRETQDPHYEFAIRRGEHSGRGRGDIVGLLPEHKLQIAWQDGCPADFALDFVRKFAARFPANVDHMCFHDGDGGFAPYERDLTDEELYDRIRGAPRTLSADLERRIIASYSAVEDA